MFLYFGSYKTVGVQTNAENCKGVAGNKLNSTVHNTQKKKRDLSNQVLI